MKKILFILIDAFAARVAVPAMEAGRLPNMTALSEAGQLWDNCTAIFPSITPAATSSLITGRYPSDHGIVGAYWYDEDEKTVVYFGGDLRVLLNEGTGSAFNDLVIRLNEERLRAPTLFEKIEAAGYTAASLNYLVFHGIHEHKVNGSWLARLLTGALFDDNTVYGPSILYHGDLIETKLPGNGDRLSSAGGLFHRLGFDDQATADLLVDLINKGGLPQFTMAYFPNNDFRCHEVGPYSGADALEEADKHVGRVIDAYGGLEKMLDDVCVIITGDHAQTEVVDDEDKAGIELSELLREFSVAEAGTPMSDDNDLVICPNLRVAQIYFSVPTSDRAEQVTNELLEDGRIDQVFRPASLLQTDIPGFQVATRERGTLHFWAAKDGEAAVEDEYGNRWAWEGDLSAVDGRVDEANCLTFGDYPNAFERISSAMQEAKSGHLWVTALPGYEFCLPHVSIHVGGGSHGALHKGDSLSPLIIAGGPDQLGLPKTPRSIDIAPLCLRLLGLDPD